MKSLNNIFNTNMELRHVSKIKNFHIEFFMVFIAFDIMIIVFPHVIILIDLNLPTDNMASSKQHWLWYFIESAFLSFFRDYSLDMRHNCVGSMHRCLQLLFKRPCFTFLHVAQITTHTEYLRWIVRDGSEYTLTHAIDWDWSMNNSLYNWMPSDVPCH